MAIMFQIVALARIYHSGAWLVGAVAFILLGSKQIKNLLRLPAAIMDAQAKGVMINHLSLEQWIDVIWSYAAIAAFIWFLDWLRRDLKKIGV